MVLTQKLFWCCGKNLDLIPLWLINYLKFFKMPQIAIVVVFGLVEDKRTFFTMTFMKTNLRSKLDEYLELVVGMFHERFWDIHTFQLEAAITMWKVGDT